VILTLVTASCAGQTAISPNCGPRQLTPDPGTGLAELRGISSDGDAWLLSPGGYPVPSVIPAEVRFKLTAAPTDTVDTRLEGVEFEPPGTIRSVVPHVTPQWKRPGREWSVSLELPRTGCWILRVTSGAVTGSFALRVK
jgi:hypothetical protein